MSSIAQHCFPQFVWRNNEMLLWNPIHKKTLKNRPEERVRLRIIEALIASGWSKHRISTEEPIGTSGEPARRTDIICYDQNFDAQILVECKAENVSINTKVAEQAARYNRSVNAPYLLMSNGLTDFWYHIADGRKAELLTDIPDILCSPGRSDNKDFTYWQRRGFAGDKAHSILRSWITGVLNTLWQPENHDIRYLSFRNSPSDLNLEHYFHISKINQQKIALGICNTPYGGTRMVAIFNRKKQNVGLIELNLDLLATGENPNTSVYSTFGVEHFNLLKHLKLDFFEETGSDELLDLPLTLNKLFDKLAQ